MPSTSQNPGPQGAGKATAAISNFSRDVPSLLIVAPKVFARIVWAPGRFCFGRRSLGKPSEPSWQKQITSITASTRILSCWPHRTDSPRGSPGCWSQGQKLAGARDKGSRGLELHPTGCAGTALVRHEPLLTRAPRVLLSRHFADCTRNIKSWRLSLAEAPI